MTTVPQVPRRRRIAIVLNDLAAGGAQRAALEQAACLDPAEWQVEVVSLELKPAAGWDLRLPSRIPVRRPGLLGLAAWWRAYAPDLVHAHLARATIACVALAPFVGRTPVVATCHNVSDWRERRFHPVRRLAHAALHRCAHVFAVSEAVRSAIADHDPGLGARTTVLYNGADLSGFRDLAGMRDAARDVLGVRPGTFVVGAVARFDPRKGLDVLLEAASGALHRVPGLEVILVGDGAERDRLVARSHELGLHQRVHFVGEHSDVRPYLAAFDLFAAPSRSEGLGIALVEALAAGIPVAGSRVGGIPEVLANGEAGWLVEPDVASWTEALVAAARDHATRARFARTGPTFAQVFSLDRTREALSHDYREVLGTREAAWRRAA